MNAHIILWAAAGVCFLLKGLQVKIGQVDLMNIGFALVMAGLLA